MKKPCTRPSRLWLCLPLLLGLSPACPGADVPALSGMEALTEQWIALRGTLAAETREWQERRDHWNREISLLGEEAGLLDRELAENREVVPVREKERAALLARREGLAEELAAVETQLEAAYARVQEWLPLIPESLRHLLPAEVRTPAKLESLMQDRSRAKQAQALLAVLSGVEAMQNQFHATRETIEIGGKRRQADVLYIGLARAFAVSPASDWAAVGVPADTAWRWSEQGVDPRQARLALDVFHRRQTATLAILPLGGDSGEQDR